MKRIENDCVGGCGDTGFGCRGSLCPLRSVPHFYCDVCGNEVEQDDFYEGELTESGFKDLCGSCYNELIENEDD